ncbi:MULTISPECIES: hypothetical protein [Corynebacterium]|uniref:ABC transporter permease n=1 Tax=Corynebacterium evansiae TaxID=2913499 RepID=A0A9X3LPG3_9CORY|nr:MULTISPECIES: hypothetical protein [Corynebacterium]MCG7267806.1 hypothetical protein [Corynebacterium sp. ACRQJ]MCZ9290383.1 hypothetical protein [Corynebacterium evansiae]
MNLFKNSLNNLRTIISAERVRLSGSRGPLVRVALPLGFLLPLIITFVVAAVAESIQSAGGIFQAQAVHTTNSAYWPIHLGSIVFAAMAAHAQASANSPFVRAAIPWQKTDQLARWLFLSALAAFSTVISVALCLLLLPSFFPVLYGQVNFFSPNATRMLITAPIYSFFAVGIGIAIGKVLNSSAAAIATLTIWALLVENAVWLVPGGAKITSWLPFLNGVFATGQDLALFPPWGRTGAMVYFAVVALLLFGLSLIKRSRP